MKNNVSDFGFVFWIHLILIFLWYISFIFISWYFILVIVLFSYLQGFLIKGCMLTYAQFGNNTDYTFFGYYLEKLGFKINKKMLKLIFFWLEPIFILLLSVLWQIIFNNSPILF